VFDAVGDGVTIVGVGDGPAVGVVVAGWGGFVGNGTSPGGFAATHVTVAQNEFGPPPLS
jgi:hypothetical protein